MTNSTETNTETKKKVGPIRTGVVIPSLILIGLTFLYFKFLFDLNLKQSVEWVGYQINGAEVNLGAVHTDFLKPGISFQNLQITDKNKPFRNIVQIGEIRVQLLWDALLRAKIVINDASILNIQTLTQRSSPGRVLPPSTQNTKSSSGLQKAEELVLNQTEKEFRGQMFGDLAQMLQGTSADEKLKSIEGDLKSSAYVKELKSDFEKTKKHWDEMLEKVPQQNELQALSQKGKSLKFDIKNPVEFAQSVKEAEKIIKELEQNIKNVKEIKTTFESDKKKYQGVIAQLEKTVQEDVVDLQKRFKIPSIDPGEFARSLFMNEVQVYLGSAKKYYDLAHHYMPPPKKKEEATSGDFIPQKRAQGKTYQFPVTVGYPLFWLQKAQITSEVSPNAEFSGQLAGEITNITSAPEYIKKPAVATLKGDFPKENILGFKFVGTFDHTTETPRDQVEMSVQSFPIVDKKLSDSQELTFNIQKANGGINLKTQFSEGLLDMKFESAMTQFQFDLNSNSKVIESMLTDILKSIPVVSLNAQITGSWSQLKFNLNSNLGEEISKGLQKQLQQKIDEVKSQLEDFVDSKISAEKAEALTQFEEQKSKFEKQLGLREGEIEKIKSQLQNELAKSKNGGTKKLEDEGKKLLKKFKLGG